jgi:hypothetical protein
MRANVYVDAFNLDYGCLKGTPYRWVDLDTFCRQLLPRDRIHRIRYFTAMVSGRSADPQQPQRQQIYLRALQTIPHLSVHLGHYLSHPVRMPLAHPPPVGPQTVEVIKTEEKGSDVNPHPPARRSRALQPTFWRQVREPQLRSSQFPPVLADGTGSIRKPPEW